MCRQQRHQEQQAQAEAIKQVLITGFSRGSTNAPTIVRRLKRDHPAIAMPGEVSPANIFQARQIWREMCVLGLGGRARSPVLPSPPPGAGLDRGGQDGRGLASMPLRWPVLP
jgi:hypothetical protein